MLVVNKKPTTRKAEAYIPVSRYNAVHALMMGFLCTAIFDHIFEISPKGLGLTYSVVT